MPNITKRQKIIVSSLVLSLCLLATGFIPLSFYLNYKLQLILGFVILAYLLSVWALWEGLNWLKAAVLMVLPGLFALAVSSYYFLLPVRWLTRLPVAAVFGLIWYTLLLSQNVFNVSTTRTIPLYRVASTWVFVLTIITASLLFNVIYSLHLFYFLNGVVTFFLCLILLLQLLWTVEMENLSPVIIVTAVLMALIVGEVGTAISFWPLSNAMASVMLTASLYLVCGVSLDHLRGRLNREVVLGYLKWGLPIFIFVYLTTSWTG